MTRRSLFAALAAAFGMRKLVPSAPLTIYRCGVAEKTPMVRAFEQHERMRALTRTPPVPITREMMEKLLERMRARREDPAKW